MPASVPLPTPVPVRGVRRGILVRLAVLVAAVALVTTGLTLGASASAQAAVIGGAITDVRVTPTTPRQGSQLTTDIDWTVPNGTREGDTFTLTLSSVLRNLPQGFALRDPETGAIVADAVLSATSPAVITFTMTAYASTHLATHGTAYVESDFSTRGAPSGVATPIVSTTGDGRSFSTTITPVGAPSGDSRPIKYGSWTRADQGRTNGDDFLMYTVDTPVGPFESAVSSDTVPAGAAWHFDCSTIQYRDIFFSAQGADRASAAVPTAADCSATALRVAWPAGQEGHRFRLQIKASLEGPTGVATPAQTFRNTATVETTAAGVSRSQSATSVDVQASGGGQGEGVNAVPAVSIVKGDSLGNAADTEADEVTLPSGGAASLVFTIANTGTEALQSVAVSDRVVSGGSVTGLSCDFSALGGPTTGTTWAGPFAPGASFGCTAALHGVVAGADHQDVGSVTATGVSSTTTVSSSNAYFARVAAPPLTPPAGPGADTPAPGGGTTPGSGTTPTTGTTGTVTPLAGPLGTTPAATPSALAYTGTDVSLPLVGGVSFLGLGSLLLVLSRRRRTIG